MLLKGKSARECCQQVCGNIVLRWPTICCEQGLHYSYCVPAEGDCM